jgi:glycosyltransferase involved in cell wall biosynthesis
MLSRWLPLGVGGAILTVIAVTTVFPRPTLAGWLGLAILAICAAAIYQTTISGVFAPVAITFWAFVAIWVGFAPLLQIRDGILPWKDKPLPQHYVTAQIILMLAVLAFWFGYTRPAVKTAPRPRRRSLVTVEKATLITAAATFLAAICIPLTGGLMVRFTTRDELKAALAEAGITGRPDQALVGLLSTLPAAAAVVALMLCLLCWRGRLYTGTVSKRALTIATVAAAVLNIIYNNPLSANRFTSFSVVLAAGFALVKVDKQWFRTAFSLTMIVGLAVLYPLANLFRNDKSRADLRIGFSAYYTYDFDGFQQTVNAVDYVDAHGHTWGYHLISALLFWVPRSIWKDKAIAAGNVVAANRGYRFQNLSLPFWAEVFVEFTLVGVVIVFFLYGLVARRADRAIRGQALGLATVFAVLFGACQIGLLRGPLGAQIPFVGAAFALALVGLLGWRGTALGWTRETDSVAGGGSSPLDGELPGGRKIRIAVLADWWWPDIPGGAERSARDVTARLSTFAEVTVFVPGTTERPYHDGAVRIQPVRRILGRRTYADGVVRQGMEFASAWLLPFIATRMARRVEAYAPDVVVAHNVSRTGPWLLRWVKGQGLPLVRVHHDLSDTCWRRSRLKNGVNCTEICGMCTMKTAIMRSAHPASTPRVCVSDFVLRELVKANLTTPGDAAVGYPLVNTAAAQLPPRVSADGGLTLGYIGRLSPVKGIESGILTAAAYLRRTGTPVRLVIAGEGRGNYAAELAALARTHGIEAELPGHLDIDTFCAQIDVALILSVWMEPFGRVALEVGTRGRPMLVSPLGGLPEAAAASGGVYAFADFRDPEAAAEALAGLVDRYRHAGPSLPNRQQLPSLPDVVVDAVRRSTAATPAPPTPAHAVHQ